MFLAGTRWIAHKVAAFDVILDKYGIYLQHMENMSEDNSFPADDRAKCKGWLKKWSEARIPLLIALSIEVLAPAKCLSKSFQAEDRCNCKHRKRSGNQTPIKSNFSKGAKGATDN